MNSRQRLTLGWIGVCVFAGIFVLLVMSPSLWESSLRSLFPDEKEVLYARLPLSSLVTRHLALVALSSGVAVVLGLAIGIFVTRPIGKSMYEIVGDLSSLGQTIPPVAVLALAVPALGFGFEPTVVALVLYSILPVVRNTITGIESVSPQLLEAARGIGMTRMQVLRDVSLPLALPVIMAGIRISIVVNIGTATIGAVVGAGGLGSIIISGLVRENPAFVLQGAVCAALFALLVDFLLAQLEKSLFGSYKWNV